MIFKRENALRISRGAKNETRRLKRPRVKAGETYMVRTSFFDTEDWGRIKILGIRRERLGAISEKSARREGCRSREEFLKMFEAINGPVHHNRKVWVVRFRYVGCV